MKAIQITICARINDDVDAKEWGDACASLIRTAVEDSKPRAATAAVKEADPRDVECIEASDL